MPENHPIDPVIDIELGGSVRHFKFDNNALILLEEKTGRDMLSENAFPEKMRATDVRLYAWAALLHEDATLLPEQVGAWINMGNIISVSRAIVGAYKCGLASSKPDGEAGESAPLVQ